MGRNKNIQQRRRFWLIFLLMAMIIGYAGLFYFVCTCTNNNDDEAKYALIVTSSIVVCIISFVLASMILKTGGISNKKEALGLPQGSIRSFIALILICIFFIISIIMYDGAEGNYVRVNNVSEDVYKSMTGTKVIRHIDSTKNNEFVASEDEFIKTKQDSINKGKLSLEQVKKEFRGTPEAKLIKEYLLSYTVDQLEPNSPEANQFAKDFQTGFMTLISAICAFYFGTKTVSDGSKANSQDNDGPDDGHTIKLKTPTLPIPPQTKGTPLALVFETTPVNSAFKITCEGENESNIVVDPDDPNKYNYTPPKENPSAKVTITATLINLTVNTSFEVKLVPPASDAPNIAQSNSNDVKPVINLVTPAVVPIPLKKGDSVDLVFETTPTNTPINCVSDDKTGTIVQDKDNLNKFTYTSTVNSVNNVTVTASLVSDPTVTANVVVNLS